MVSFFRPKVHLLSSRRFRRDRVGGSFVRLHSFSFYKQTASREKKKSFCFKKNLFFSKQYWLARKRWKLFLIDGSVIDATLDRVRASGRRGIHPSIHPRGSTYSLISIYREREKEPATGSFSYFSVFSSVSSRIFSHQKFDSRSNLRVSRYLVIIREEERKRKDLMNVIAQWRRNSIKRFYAIREKPEGILFRSSISLGEEKKINVWRRP